MYYIGSKKTLLPWINKTITETVGDDLSDKVFCDLFSGTSVVGQSVKKRVKKVISNDIESYSFVLSKNYIENHLDIPNKQEYIDQLNNIPLIDTGFIYQNYCLGSGSDRRFFSDENGKKIDTIRMQIEKWYITKSINSNLYYFLLASLIESADKVANTISVYGAHLKYLKKRAAKSLVLKAATFILNDNTHTIYQEDANKLVKSIEGDILYLDPPYNGRQYGANYHLLNTIAKYNKFTPKGKTGLREYISSSYCIKTKIIHVFEDLLRNANFQYIFLSYNNEGIMTPNQIKNIMKKYGNYQCRTKDYQRFGIKAGESTKVKEYMHILKKQPLKDYV